MKYATSKSKIPILWIDTWVIFRLVRGLHDPKSSKQEKELTESIVDKLTSLTDKKKIICPEPDRGIEIDSGGRLVEEARRLQAQISRGISFHHYSSIENLQIQHSMRGYISKLEEITLPWEDLFFEDPEKAIDKKSPFIVSVNFDIPADELKERKESNKQPRVLRTRENKIFKTGKITTGRDAG